MSFKLYMCIAGPLDPTYMFPDEVASVVGPVQRKVEIQAIGEAALHERGGRLMGFVSYRACVDTKDLAHCNSPGAIWRRGGQPVEWTDIFFSKSWC